MEKRHYGWGVIIVTSFVTIVTMLANDYFFTSENKPAAATVETPPSPVARQQFKDIQLLGDTSPYQVWVTDENPPRYILETLELTGGRRQISATHHAATDSFINGEICGDFPVLDGPFLHYNCRSVPQFEDLDRLRFTIALVHHRLNTTPP